MAFDRFLIAPMQTGLETDLRSWQIPEDAFQQLENMYVFRGRVRKRFGSSYTGFGWDSELTQPLYSRLSINIGNTDGSGHLTVTVPGSIWRIGQLFSVGDTILTVHQATGATYSTNPAASIATYDTTNGHLVLASTDLTTPVFFYPAEPVMGIDNYEVGPVNNQPTYAFDTQFVYRYAGGQWLRSDAAIWHGTNYQFYWVANWRGITPNVVVMFVTNFNATVPTPAATDDPIWYTIDGVNWVAAIGADAFYFLPTGQAAHAGPYVKTAKLIIPFKGRLLLLNTIENNNPAHDGTGGTNSRYVNRCRYSHNGSPFSQNAWYEQNTMDTSGTPGLLSVANGAGYIDAPTQDIIVSCEFIKDRLIVFFQRSTWELAYTGNQILPFVWQKINTELGVESTFSVVPFDKVIMGISNTGVHACTGANVERIDNKIPDTVFSIQQSNFGAKRVFGIRDYFVEMVYWTYPIQSQNPFSQFPSKVLVYNYKNSSWGINDDCITAFGYLEQSSDTTWETANQTWQQMNATWSSGVLAAEFRQVLAGNQQGFVFIVRPDISFNEAVMQVTDFAVDGAGFDVYIRFHNLNGGDYINFKNMQGLTGINGVTFQVTVLSPHIVYIVPQPGAPITGVYTGGGVVSRVSEINLLSKRWNPYISKGRNVYVAKIDFGVERTADGEALVDYYASSNFLSMVNQGSASGSIMGTSVLETFPYPDVPFELVQDLVWHPIYFQTQGEFIQIQIYLNDLQLRTPAIANSEFTIEGMVLHTQATSTRLQ